DSRRTGHGSPSKGPSALPGSADPASPRSASASRTPASASPRTGPASSSTGWMKRLIASGHLIDSGLMSKYLNVIVENGGSSELHRFDIGKTVRDFSTVTFSVSAPDPRRLDLILT